MRLLNMLDPNKKLAETSIVWYVMALLLMLVALAICFTEGWQTEGFVEAVYVGDSISKGKEISEANSFSMRPHMTSLIWASLMYGALIVRRYIRNVSNLPTFLLVFANLLFIASLIEAFLPARSICLIKIGWVEALCINPQTLLISTVLFAWIGMRALAGVAILVIAIAFLSHIQEVNAQLGSYGTFYVLCGFLSLLVQVKLPYMKPDGGWYMSLLSDFGAVGNAATANVKALGETVTEIGAVTAKSVAKIAAP